MLLKLKKTLLNGVISEAIVYSIANALNRGTILLITPLLLLAYSIEEVGRISVIYAISQFVMPFLLVGMSAAIVREGVGNSKSIDYLSIQTYKAVIFLFLVVLLANELFVAKHLWYTRYAILIGGANALFEVFLTSMRAKNEKKIFSFFCFLKSILIILAVVIAIFTKVDIDLLCLLLFFSTLFVFAISILIIKPVPLSDGGVTYRKCVKYSSFLIPHAIAVWALSSSDKIIIDYFLSDYELGIYSIAYTFGMFLIIVNSGIALALPRYVFSDIEKYSGLTERNKFVTFYTGLYITLSLFMEFFFWVDRLFLGMLPEDKQVYEIFRIIAVGIYFSGLYHFYSLYIMYEKKTKLISTISMLVAIFNILLNYFLIPKYGIIVAAYTTVFSYLLYFIFIFYTSCKIRKSLKVGMFQHILLIAFLAIAYTCLLFLSGILFSLLD